MRASQRPVPVQAGKPKASTQSFRCDTPALACTGRGHRFAGDGEMQLAAAGQVI
jgi:hypothetical protein